jgi:2-hydroxy-6-oxonona-2,4-dienedioate hydrolase
MTKIVNLNGSDIRFEIHGEGVPVVYTPGGFWTLERGRALAERLSSLGYKVLLWDRPNTGESGLMFQEDNLLRAWADQLHELLLYTGHSPACIAGGSGGLLSSLYFAHAYPEELKALILISPPTDDKEFWGAVIQGTFLELADAAEQRGMAAALESLGGPWDFFEWPDQFARVPQKKLQFLALSPMIFAEAMRAWALAFMADGRPHLAGLSDKQLAAINIPALVFSGAGGIHPQHAAEILHAKLPQSELVISSEYYAETWAQILEEEEKGGDYYDTALAERIDEFIRSMK